MNNLKELSNEEISNLRKIREEGIKHLIKVDVEVPCKTSFLGIVGLFEDMISPGFLMTYDHGNVLRYGEISGSFIYTHYFRGENKVYPGDTTSSLARKLNNKSDLEYYVELLLQDIKINILKKLLNKNNILSYWQYGTIFVYLIAQHYGIKTQYLDITDDIDIALFFANTKAEGDKFVPILESDIEYGKYAVLYYKKSFYDDIYIRPIGYQPFTRCHMQRGYFIDTNEQIEYYNYGLSKTNYFIKYKFKRNDELTMELYNKFEGGNLIYPQEEKNILSKIVTKIENNKTFSFKEIKDMNALYKKKYSDDEIFNKLKELNYVLLEEVSREELDIDFNLLSFEDYLKRENIKISYRIIKKGSAE